MDRTFQAAGSSEVDSVVWLDLSKNAFPWWPCRVDRVDGQMVYTSFGDDVSYQQDNFKPNEVREYNCKELTAMIAKGKKRLGKRVETLGQYTKAILKAVQFIQSKKDPGFSLGMEILEDISALSNSNEATSTPRTTIRLTRNSIYTTEGGESGSGSDSTYDWMSDISLSSSGGRRRIPRKKGRTENGVKRNGNVTETENMVLKKPRHDMCETKEMELAAPKRLDFDVTPLPAQQRVCVFPRDPLLPNIHPPSPRRGCVKTVTDWEKEGDSQCGHIERSERKDTPTSPSKDTPTPPSPVKRSKETLTPNTTPSTITPPTHSVTLPTHSPPSQPASPPHLPSSDGDTPPPPLTGTPTGNFVSFSDSDMDLKSEEEEEEDDLPPVNLEVKESVKIHELNTNTVVWAKDHRNPYWPALVTLVSTPKKKKNKSRASVLFFGCSDTHAYRISKDKNIALFGTKLSREYTNKGNESSYTHRDQFALAVKEAQDFLRERAEGAFTGTPKQLFRKIAAGRKKAYVSYNSFVDDADHGDSSLAEEEEEEEDRDSTSGGDEHPGSVNEKNSSSEDSDYGELEDDSEDESDTLYTYTRVCKEIESIRPKLVGIIKGEVPSVYHSIYVSGSQKELKKLQLSQKYGPIKKWNMSRVVKLINNALLDIVREVGSQKSEFKYAHDVLLPEAMVRVKARVENISIEQALNEFESSD